VSLPQAYEHAGAEAAVGALIAHHERQRSGRGQHVDVSAQQAVAQATQSRILDHAIGDNETQRLSGGLKVGPFDIRMVWPAKDGYVSIVFLPGSAIGPFTRRLMEYICDEGFCDEATRDKDWIKYDVLLLTGQEPAEEYERVKVVVEEFTKTRTKAELLQLAVERGFLIGPITTVEDVANSEQLAARQYWRTLEHPELGRSFRYPGPFAKLSATPITYRRRPPTVGEHNREIYVDELGLTDQEVDDLRVKGVI
jgi:crotonobetainyl-CoA:carnitine CoA-transferase CaiB-like acyl-CoA transferase